MLFALKTHWNSKDSPRLARQSGTVANCLTFSTVWVYSDLWGLSEWWIVLPRLLPLVGIRKYVSESSALSPREARYETAPTFVSKLL